MIKIKRENVFLGKKFDYNLSVIDLLFLKGPESGFLLIIFKETFYYF